MNVMTDAARRGARLTDAAREGARWARDGGEYVLLHASRASDRARERVRRHPVSTLLVAAAAGALVAALVQLLAQRDDR